VCVNSVVNPGLIEQRTFLCDVLWCAEGSAARACECFGGVRRAEPLCVGPCKRVVYCKLEGGGCGASGVEWAFGFLALLVFLHVYGCCP
jgi:hypothetical protein